ncbi:kappa-type opioid receptor-like [Acropora millepora]|uniref:kappa-type opioid receptor-like n=1 Tax=Acropora millepora TaxID=45264 RepID=UPI001CF4CEA7|nr:kappa-type opioid receptor-like [Acropora millepora]
MAVHWYWLLSWLLTILGLVGNSWVIFLITKKKRLHTTSNCFILSLALADLSVTCGYFPVWFVCKVLLVNACKDSLRFNFTSFFTEAAMLTLLAVITERYIAVVHPLKYISFMTSEENHYHGFVILGNSINSLCLSATTSHIIFTARKITLQMSALMVQVQFNQTSSSLTIKTGRTGSQLGTVRLVAALTAIFMACYGTEIYVSTCEVFEICQVTIAVQTAFSLLLIGNSALNPIVYAVLKRDIKRETVAMLSGTKKRVISTGFCFRKRI